ncbi:hypothetical protein TWF694_000463 [Orbilia ellipsospora]|uniref:Uncharacterized protein n=1 Tax=Orbilia ellipsospora TaxID=2528407 RepID=A0AAV9XNN2_9PEZI
MSGVEPTTDLPPVVIPANYQICEVDYGKGSTSYPDVAIPVDGEEAPPPAPPLGVLSNFTGVYAGPGFNMIFRPNGKTIAATTFPNPLNPPPPGGFSNNVLELNLTRETLRFWPSLGSTPNRGLNDQKDIFLNGVPYLQTIDDVTNQATGKADKNPSGIHFEPGLWMAVPATTDPQVPDTLSRMASIPHGTAINAQGFAPTKVFPGPPDIKGVNITPFRIGDPTARIKFASQTASNPDTARLPQDLTKFINEGTITQAVLDDPNSLLRDAIKSQTITETIVFKVSTGLTEMLSGGGAGAPTTTGATLGGGTSNIAFLVGAGGQNPNANAAVMEATFWVETVECELELPYMEPGDCQEIPAPGATYDFEGRIVPSFKVEAPCGVTEGQKITASFQQIQYSQNVNLDFANLTWPHVSIATLVPTDPIVVPESAFDEL